MKKFIATLCMLSFAQVAMSQTWQQLNYQYEWKLSSAPKIFVSPDDGLLVAGVKSDSKKISVSKDGGTTWTDIFPAMSMLTAEFGPDGTTYLITTKRYLTTALYPTDTMYTSTDGLTWTNSGQKIRNGESDLEFEITSNNTLIFPNGSGSKMAKSTDNGQSWTDLNFNFKQLSASSTGDTIIISSGSPWPGGIEYSHDGGHTFTASTGVNAECIPLVLPNGEIWAASLNKLWKSTDGGASFTGNSPNPSIPLQIGEIHYASNGKFYVRSLGSILETTDGITYNNISGNLSNVMDIALSANYIYAVTADSNLHRTPLPGGNSVANQSMNPTLMKIYPNPASDRIHVAAANGTTPTLLLLIDPSGRSVRKQANTSSLDVSGLAPGMYFLSVSTEKARFLEKVFIK